MTLEEAVATERSGARAEPRLRLCLCTFTQVAVRPGACWDLGSFRALPSRLAVRSLLFLHVSAQLPLPFPIAFAVAAA